MLKYHRNLFQRLCSYDNLLLAFRKAKKRKGKKPYVIEFEKDLDNNLFRLQWELLTQTYWPRPMKNFTVRDPKTRKISASNFRDRVVHHALCNMIEPIFERRFIHDTFANRKGRGTSAALARFDLFMRKATGNGKHPAFALKADIRHYFKTVDHEVLLRIIGRRVKDCQVLWLVRVILANYKTSAPGKGMPLGNLTSQFFANVYLAELDEFVKHRLRARFYLRYVDDFLILERSPQLLQEYQDRIDTFLCERLRIEMHPDKTKIVPLERGVGLLGFRAFYHYRILKKSNLRRAWVRMKRYREQLASGQIMQEHVSLSLAGWEGYAMMGNTYGLRQQIRSELAVPCSDLQQVTLR